jgi:hypothetical protein
MKPLRNPSVFFSKPTSGGSSAMDVFRKSLRFEFDLALIWESSLSLPGLPNIPKEVLARAVESSSRMFDLEVHFASDLFQLFSASGWPRNPTAPPRISRVQALRLEELLNVTCQLEDTDTASNRTGDTSCSIDVVAGFHSQLVVVGGTLRHYDMEAGKRHRMFDLPKQFEATLVEALGGQSLVPGSVVTVYFDAGKSGHWRIGRITLNRVGQHWEAQRAIGKNIPLLSVLSALDRVVATRTFVQSEFVIPSNKGETLRYDIFPRRVVFDLDGTLVWRGEPIVQMVQLALTFSRDGIPLEILTRNPGNIRAVLGDAGVPKEIFCNFTQLLHGEKKSKYIKAGSIFFDDEFHQRLEVSEALGIPVMSVDQVDFW